MNHCRIASLAIALVGAVAFGQPFGPPDRGRPGDEMIQNYLRRETMKIHARFLENVESAEDWTKLRPPYKQEYFYMLGLQPMPERTPLKATVTGTLEGDGFVVELLHYQSRPGLYVTGNLYRPAEMNKGKRLPAIFYVCGHSNRGRNGNKTAYQSHGMWFARHGYVCLVVDSLQLGEIAGLHHGTYREGRWWWHSRGYTPAGVECWNGVRGIDYLVGRPDVDPDRIAVTGISGGGASTYWIAAADERVTVAVPVSGMADLPSYVANRVINGHCDCMFLHNAFRWPWTRIAGLIAPRPLLFVNSDQDRIFPMDANDRVINRLERLYSLFGAGDRVDAVVSVGGHAYRQDIRQAAYRFINSHLKNDPRIVTDSEVDLVTGPRNDHRHPIDPEKLRVFPTDADIPSDQRNTTIDESFVPMANVAAPKKGDFGQWKKDLLAELRRVTFGYFPERIPPAKRIEQSASADGAAYETEPGITVRLKRFSGADRDGPKRVLLLVANGNEPSTDWLVGVKREGDAAYLLLPRGVGPTRWTQKDPPNYVARSHVLLGRTVDTGRAWDVASVARWLHDDAGAPVVVAGSGGAGIIAAYAALFEPDVSAVVVKAPPSSHMEGKAPQFLNVLRVLDVPQALGMLAPRPLTILGGDRKTLGSVKAIYAAADAAEKLETR